MSTVFIFIINLALISLCLFVHYEAFANLNKCLSMLQIRHRAKVFWSMIIVIITHVIEVWIFAIAYYFCTASGTFGILYGDIEYKILDFVYYSFVTYTSLGLGDILPIGDIRFMTGVESLVGLLLIAWSASFMYFQMQKYWDKH